MAKSFKQYALDKMEAFKEFDSKHFLYVFYEHFRGAEEAIVHVDSRAARELNVAEETFWICGDQRDVIEQIEDSPQYDLLITAIKQAAKLPPLRYATIEKDWKIFFKHFEDYHDRIGDRSDVLQSLFVLFDHMIPHGIGTTTGTSFKLVKK